MGAFDDLVPQEANSQQQPASNTQAMAPQQSSGAFDDLVPQEQQTQTSSDSSGMMSSALGNFDSFMENMNRQFGKIAEQTLTWGAQGIDAVTGYNTADTMRAYTARMDQSAAQAAEQYPVAGVLGSVAGDIARTIPAAVASGGGSLVGQGVKMGIGSALLSGAEPATDATNRLEKMAGSFALGGAGQFVGGLLSDVGRNLSSGSGAGVINKVNDARAAAANTFANEAEMAPGMLSKGSAALKNIDDAKALGTWLSPAEALGTASARNTEGNLIVGNKALKLDTAIANSAREDLLRGKLDEVVSGLTPKGTAAAQEEAAILYKNLNNFSLSNSSFTKVMENPTISNYLQSMVNQKAIPKEILDLPNNNVGKLNEVKKLISDDYNSLFTSAAKSSGDSTKMGALREARKELNTALEAAGGDTFTKATALGQQLKVQSNIREKIANAALLKGEDESTLAQLHRTLAGSPAEKEQFLKSIGEAGGDVKTTEQLLNTFNNISNGKMDVLVGKPLGSASKNINLGNDKANLIQNLAENVITGKFNREAVSLLTDNKWLPEVQKVLESRGKPSFFNTLTNVLEKVGKVDFPKSDLSVGEVGKGLLSGATKSVIPGIGQGISGMLFDYQNRAK